MSTRGKRRNLIQLAVISAVGYIGYKTWLKLVFPPKFPAPDAPDAVSPMKSKWGREVKADQSINSDPNMLVHVVDHFNGIRIDSECLPMDKGKFESKLTYSLQRWQSDKRRGIMLKIPLDRIHLLEIAVAHQFTIHHARPEYIMLIRWLPRDEANMIPDHCHCYISVGCIVINKRKQAVVIQEKWNFGQKGRWKLPGGAIDRCENIHDAAVRETKEETGLDVKFMGIIGFRHFHPFRFGNTSDLYFFCLLKYDGQCDGGKEFQRDENEIAAIQWMDMQEFMTLDTVPLNDTEGGKERILRNVDKMVEHWDDDNVHLDLLCANKTKPDREYFVFSPSSKSIV